MDLIFEKKVIKKFFSNRCSDRLIYEAEKKRNILFDKLAHTCEDFVKSDVILQKNKMPSDSTEIIDFFSGGKNDMVYVMALNSNLDGEYVRLHSALKMLYRNGSPYMLISLSCDKAYLETEYNFSVHYSYFLNCKFN